MEYLKQSSSIMDTDKEVKVYHPKPRWYACECGVSYHRYDAILRHVDGSKGHSYYDDARYALLVPELTRWYPNKQYPGSWANVPT